MYGTAWFDISAECRPTVPLQNVGYVYYGNVQEVPDILCFAC